MFGREVQQARLLALLCTVHFVPYEPDGWTAACMPRAFYISDLDVLGQAAVPSPHPKF